MTIPIQPGDIVQITNERPGLVGAFLLVEDVRPWGVLGFVHHPGDFTKAQQIPLRLTNGNFELVGRAAVLPDDFGEPASGDDGGGSVEPDPVQPARRHLHAVRPIESTDSADSVWSRDALAPVIASACELFLEFNPDAGLLPRVQGPLVELLLVALRSALPPLDSYPAQLREFVAAHRSKLAVIFDSYRDSRVGSEYLFFPGVMVVFERLQNLPFRTEDVVRATEAIPASDFDFLCRMWSAT